MALRSYAFSGNSELELCAVDHAHHVVPGARGEHVALIQMAVQFLDGVSIAESELQTQTYGPSTAGAVLNYKKARNIINPAYQTAADNITGIMTIKALDDEMVLYEATPRGSGDYRHKSIGPKASLRWPVTRT